MKKFFIIGLVLISVASCNNRVYLFTGFHEPANAGLRLLYSYDGYKWQDLDTVFLKPVVGDKIMRDPSIVQGPDGVFQIVWTCAWKGNKGFGYASSKDLIHWSEERVIDVMKNEPTTVNVWAPEIFYDDVEKQFIIIWASTIPFRFPKGIEDEDNNHRMYYTTTKDFKTFSDTKLFYDPGFSVIDCEILKRGKKDYVLILKDNTRPNRNIKVAFGKSPLGPYGKPSEAFTPSYTEGPAVEKVGDEYLIYFDQYRDKIYGAVKTKDFKTFINITKEISVPNGHKHGTIVKVNKKVLEKLLQFSTHKLN
jgi:hypothetical protein